MYRCTNCKAEFKKPVKKGGLGALWIIFIFLSMGLAIFLYAIMRALQKPVCPRCGSEHYINLDYKG